MSTRDEEREWLVTTKAWQAERDAVGLERLVDVFQISGAAVETGRVDLRRWTHTNPAIAVQLRAIRQALDLLNREMMEWIQDQTAAKKGEGS